MKISLEKTAGAEFRSVVLGLCLCLLSALPAAAWHIILRCTQDIAYTSVWEPNTNRWQFEFSVDGGRYWTYCGSIVTGNQETAFYKNPNSMLFRARKID